MFLQRHITESIRAALADTPVVLLSGARQSGKSTVARMLMEEGRLDRYLTLGDPAVFATARDDPDTLLSGISGSAVIDEVQRAPDLFRAVKASVDRDRRPGRYLLIGSADVMTLPRVAESLAGRMEIVTLWPFSQGEREGRRETFIDRAFGGPGALAETTAESGSLRLIDRVTAGGYPEAVGRADEKRRGAWFDSYVTTILQRDVRDIANIEGTTAMPRLLALLAARAGGLLNYAELSRVAALPASTLKRYVALLHATYLIRELPAWSTNLGKRLVKAPKLMMVDTGLAAHLQGLSSDPSPQQATLFGPLLENFVAMELIKQCGWSMLRATPYHYRTQAGAEVDIVLEDRRGRIVGVEVKAGEKLERGQLRGLIDLAESHRDRFIQGVVLYRGREIIRLDPSITAMPVSALWS